MVTLGDIARKRVGELVGAGASTARNTKLGKAVRRFGVSRSSEFDRVVALPRRDWRTDPTIDGAIVGLEAFLHAKAGAALCSPECKCPRSLWKEQAVALLELADTQGVFGALGVGKGKALLSVLAPVVLGAERPILFVPAQLRDQTMRQVLPKARAHWKTHPGLRVHGYSELSIASGKRMLLTYRSDLILLDEAHEVKSMDSARGKRVREYLKEEPLTRVVVLSGSVTKRSILDYWQLLLWSHKPDRCPVPNDWQQLKDWSCALDEGIPPEQVMAPGALMLLCNEGETARAGYRRRLTETPGVVASGDNELACSIVIARHPVKVPNHISSMMAEMRRSWATPGGEEFSEAIELWRHMRELACGFYYRWDPAAPSDWLLARKAWKTWARETIRNNRRSLDSELVLVNYLDRVASSEETRVSKDDFEGIKLLTDWRTIKDTFDPNTVAVWESDFALTAASLWLNTSVSDEHPEGGIVWTSAVAFGERLATESGYRYFGAGMEASTAIADATGPIIASISAHGQGKNLQRWSRNLVATPPSSGKTWEQLAGRTHRHGQMGDKVEFDVWTHAEELEAALRQARNDAAYIEATIGARQKLCFADWAFDLGVA